MIHNKTKTLYLYRFGLTVFISLCVGLSLTVFKSSSYLTGYASYDPGDKLHKLVEKEQLADEEIVKDKLSVLKEFQESFITIEKTQFKLRSNFWSFITLVYDIDIGTNQDFSIQYSYHVPDPEVSRPNCLIYESNDGDSYKLLTGIANKPDFFTKDEILKIINLTIENQESLLVHHEKSPITLLEFAYSSILSDLGFEEYTISAQNTFARRLNIILRWAFFVISGIWFYEIRKKWN